MGKILYLDTLGDKMCAFSTGPKTTKQEIEEIRKRQARMLHGQLPVDKVVTVLPLEFSSHTDILTNRVVHTARMTWGQLHD